MIVDHFSGKGKRENNEDYILIHQISDECSVYLLADGMGGYSYGEIASSLACKIIVEYIIVNYGKTELNRIVHQAVLEANELIRNKQVELASKFGTTIAGIIIEGNKALFFWLGDVRIYHYRNNELLFHTEDHSLIFDLKKQGRLSAKDIERYKGIVTKSLSGNSIDRDFPVREIFLDRNDILIICSDGFWQNFNVNDFIAHFDFEMQDYLYLTGESVDDNFSIIRIEIA